MLNKCGIGSRIKLKQGSTSTPRISQTTPLWVAGLVFFGQGSRAGTFLRLNPLSDSGLPGAAAVG